MEREGNVRQEQGIDPIGPGKEFAFYSADHGKQLISNISRFKFERKVNNSV